MKDRVSGKEIYNEKPSVGIFVVMVLIAVLVCGAVGYGVYRLAEVKQAEKEASASQDEIEEAEAQPEESVIIPVEYILPDSSSRFLGKGALVNLSQDQLKKARNEIYARHGRKFSDPELQEYFAGLSWYQGSIEPADFSEDLLNEFERANVKLIAEYETEMGYR